MIGRGDGVGPYREGNCRFHGCRCAGRCSLKGSELCVDCKMEAYKLGEVVGDCGSLEECVGMALGDKYHI